MKIRDGSRARHAVGEIADGGSEIGGFVPPHDRAEIIVNEKSGPARTIRHDERSSPLARRQRAAAAADTEPAPLVGRPLHLETGEAGVKASGQHDLPAPALAAVPAKPCKIIGYRGEHVGAVVPDIAPAVAVVIHGISEKG